MDWRRAPFHWIRATFGVSNDVLLLFAVGTRSNAAADRLIEAPAPAAHAVVVGEGDRSA
jgi:hypothetical protein